ncbi:MAG: hypothetical protein V4667_06235 [Bacteroidota bacterium]
MNIRILFLLTFIFSIKICVSQTTTLFLDTMYYINGVETKDKIKEEGLLQKGLKTGTWKRWYSNGQLANETEYTIYHKNEIKICYDVRDLNGQTFDTTNLKNNINEFYSFATGKWINYYDNGKIESKGLNKKQAILKINFIEAATPNGEFYIASTFSDPEPMKHGNWIYYDYQGNISELFSYVNGYTIFQSYGNYEVNLQKEICAKWKLTSLDEFINEKYAPEINFTSDLLLEFKTDSTCNFYSIDTENPIKISSGNWKVNNDTQQLLCSTSIFKNTLIIIHENKLKIIETKNDTTKIYQFKKE